MKFGTITNALLVFLGGATYGLSGPFAKFAYADGWTWQQTAFAQGFLAAVLFALACVLVLAPQRQLARLSVRQVVGMIALGVNNSMTTLFYMYALSRLPVAVALTMLFQFAWLGIVLQLVLERRGPNAFEIASAALVVAGTVLTTGILQADLSQLDPIGMLAGFAAAVSYALFIHFSGKAGLGVPWAQRGFFICLGSSLVTILFCPDIFTQPHVLATWPKDGLPIALSAQFIPVILLGLGTPHLATGISTIMAASELPSGIVFSATALSEAPTLLQVVGVVAVLGGIVVSQIPALTSGTAGSDPKS